MFKKNTRNDQQLLFTPENMYSENLQSRLKNHWSTHFYEKVFRFIDESQFAPLFSDQGRPNFPVNILAGLEILKEMHGLSDEQLYDRYHFDYTFQRALGVQGMLKNGFAIRTLYYFRAAVAECESKTGTNLYRHIFESGRDRMIQEIGLNTGALRTDSVMIEANMKKMSRVALFHKVFSNLVRDMLRKKVTLSEQYTSFLKHDEDSFCYRLKSEDTKTVLEELGQKIREVLLDHGSTVVDMKSKEDAERLLSDQCIIENDRITIKSGNQIKSSALQNPADSDATYRRKGNAEYRGYSTHAVETCDPENPVQAIVDVDTVTNIVDDASVLASNLKRIKDSTGVEVIITDGGYFSSAVREECDDLNMSFIITALRGHEQKSDRLNSMDFKYKAGKIFCCPAGHAPATQSLDEYGTLRATFSKRHCSSCVLQTRCMAFRRNMSGYICVDERRRWLDERTKHLADESYLKLCRLRPPVEGLMEKLKPKYLRGRILFRGLVRVNSRMILKAAALNFRRYLAWVLTFLEILAEKMPHNRPIVAITANG